MKIAKNSLVHLEYRLSDADGVHLNPDEEELIYLHGGYGHIFEELEDILEGKGVNDSFKLTLSPEKAFGAYKEELISQESVEELPEDIFIGMELDGYLDESPEEGIIYVVTNIEGDIATLNANHPLAGRTLTFEGVITEIQELSDEEVEEILNHEHHHHDEH